MTFREPAWLDAAETAFAAVVRVHGAGDHLFHSSFGAESGAQGFLDDYANTSSAGSIIAFHKHQDDMTKGDLGLICSFGAGYSAGTVFVQKR